MPVSGNRRQQQTSNSFNPMKSFATSFMETAVAIRDQGVDLFSEPQKALMVKSSKNALKNFFTENMYDPTEYEKVDPANAALLAEDAQNMAEELFENDVEAIREHSALNAYNPVIGMTFPLHKNILMNNVFDKGAIPKFVAREPKFTMSMERRILVAPDGSEIDLFKEQYKIKDAINAAAPWHEVELTLPQTEGATDLLDEIGASESDNLSIDTYISAIKLSGIYLEKGDINPETKEPAENAGEVTCWVPVHYNFTPNYGPINRIIAAQVAYKTKDSGDPTKEKILKDVLTGYFMNNKLMIASTSNIVTDVRLKTRLDTSNAMIKTASVKWDVTTEIVEIGTAIPINTTVSPEEVKDVQALYNTNQLSKILSIMKTVLGDYKDSSIKGELDTSFDTMDPMSKYSGTFDFVPPSGYALDHVQWRHSTFMDYFDSVVTGLTQVLNDPNMTVTIFGAPDIIRKLTPTEYTYQTPSNIGPIELDFVKTVVTSDKRVYQFIASDKLRGNPNLIVVLCPRNTERIIYRIYDYQMYVSNEIRNAENPTLPAIHAFERWKFVSYQPVQGRIKILHPSGYTEIAPNDDPIGGAPATDWNFLATGA